MGRKAGSNENLGKAPTKEASVSSHPTVVSDVRIQRL